MPLAGKYVSVLLMRWSIQLNLQIFNSNVLASIQELTRKMVSVCTIERKGKAYLILHYDQFILLFGHILFITIWT